MSREWHGDAFSTEAATPAGFVPGDLFAQAPAVSMDTLAEALRMRVSPFRARAAGPAGAPKSFVPAQRFGSAAAGDAERQDAADAAPSTAVAVEVLPPLDPAQVYAEGFAEGQRVAAQRSAEDAAACARMIGALSGAAAFDRALLAARMRETVLLLVGQLVGEAGISPDKLVARIDGAVHMLADVTEPARIHLNPADLAAVSNHLAPNVAAVADPAIERGGFCLETMSAIVEDGPSHWIDQLAAALDRVALPEA